MNAIRLLGYIVSPAFAVFGLLPMFFVERKSVMNSMMVLHPYKKGGTWMFDDERRGLLEEPFVAGVPLMLELAVAKQGLKNPQAGFTLVFSATPFPGHQYVLHLAREREENFGNWYQLEGTELTGWLCPALFKYFDEAPDELYFQVSNKAN